MTNSGAGTELSMMATVNRVIDKLHDSLGLTDSDFYCECGQIGCKARITLTRAEYANLRDDDRPVLVAGHANRRPPGLLAQANAFPDASHLNGDPRGR